MNVLVTGGSGFIGGYVLRHLRNCGFTVINFDLVDDKQGKSDFIRGSILDFEAVQRAVEKSDIVFHFAGFSNINLVKDNPKDCIELNITGTANFLEAIRKKGSGKFVFASSVYVHNTNGHFYTTSKLASELICENYHGLYGLPVAILRLGTVYGEQSRHQDVVSIFARNAAEGKSISIYGSGNQVRHFIHGEDIAEACARIIAKVEPSGTYILSSRQGVSINELAEIVRRTAPGVVIHKYNNTAREDDYQGDLGDGLMVEKTYYNLQWKPVVDINTGVRRLIAFFKGGAD